MKKIIKSTAIIVAVAAVVVGVTMSFFSDEETSEGNSFTAGMVDLTLSSEGSANNEEVSCTFNDGTVDGAALIACDDVKPGDAGEVTLSFDIQDNPVYACMNVNNLVDSDVTCVEPELDPVDPDCSVVGDSDTNGELDESLEIMVWIDDGFGVGTACNNVFEAGEDVVYDGPIGAITGALPTGSVMIAGPAGLRTDPIPPGEQCVGVEWSVPTTVGNIAQTDSLSADLSFYVEQARHNDGFVCP